MKIHSSGIINGIIAGRFGTRASEADQIADVPIRSLPIAWENLPEGTVSLALVMQDYDAIPVCGFSWIHWLVANIDPNQTLLEEHASQTDTTLLQGKNSLASKQLCGDQPESVTDHYGGPRPPDADHEYEMALYALDTTVDLQQGFRLNELRKAMRGHILAEATLTGIYMYK